MTTIEKIQLITLAYIDSSKSLRLKNQFSSFKKEIKAFLPLTNSTTENDHWCLSLKSAYKEIKEMSEFDASSEIYEGKIDAIELNEISNFIESVALKEYESTKNESLLEAISYLKEVADENRPRRIVIPLEVKSKNLIAYGRSIDF